MAEVNIPGLIGIIVSYMVLLGIGVYAAKKRGKGAEEMMLAGRSLGLCLGICTMTGKKIPWGVVSVLTLPHINWIATWVGGGYILGTAEMVYDPSSGVAYAFAMWAGPLSMFINGYFFANKIRTGNYVTMLDPFQEKYGSRMSGLLFIPTALGEMFWAASVFYGLGTTFSVVVGLDKTVSVLMSVGVTVIYSMTGGLYSVAFTDVIQLAFIFVGLWLSLPFASTHPAVSNIVENSGRWVGQLHIRYIGVWLDYSLMAVLGSIPWQEYYQRVLACKSTREARILTYTGGVLSTVLFALPAMLLGAVGACTDWSHPALRSVSTDGFNDTAITFENSLVLPMVLQYLTPTAVTFIALGAVAAAVMSSADSILIASSTLFAHNVYKLAFRQTASDKEIVWVMRIALFAIGACAAAMAIMVQSVVYLFYLCADIVYVVLFPQFCSIMYLKNTNTYGALAGYVVSIVLRMLSGDPSLGVKPVIKYPYYSPEEGQLLPFRTFSMLAGWITLILVSRTADYLFKNRIVSPEKDIFRCFNRQIQVRVAIINPENENDGNSGRDFNRNEVDKNVTDTQTEEKVPLRSKVEMCSENGDFSVRTRTLSNVKLEEQV